MTIEREICGAKTRGGWPCKRPAGWGTGSRFGRCAWHGGKSPSGRVHAAKLEAQAQAVELGAEIPTDPAEAMRWGLAVLRGEAAWLQQKLRERSDENPGIPDREQMGFARALGERAERLVRAAAVVAGTDIEGKRLELDSLVLDRIAAAIRSAVADTGLGREDTEKLNAALSVRFNELADQDSQVPRELPR